MNRSRRSVTLAQSQSVSGGRRLGVSAAAAVVALTVGAGIWTLTDTTSPEPSAAPIRAVPAMQPSRSTAVRTAVDALYALTVPALTDRTRFEAAVTRYAAPEATEHVAAVFGAGEREAIAAFSRRDAVVRGAPLGYRVDRYSNTTASVAIWSVAIAGAPGEAAVSQWRTLVVDLSWTPSGWRVTSGAGVSGPAPSTPLSELAAEAAGFRSFRYVP